MLIAITSQKEEQSSQVEKRFGRAPWFITFNTDTKEYQSFQNPGTNQSSGAGVSAAQFIIDKKINIIISGDFGPNASRAFQAAKTEMRLFNENTLTVQDAIDQYQNNKLPKFQ